MTICFGLVQGLLHRRMSQVSDVRCANIQASTAFSRRICFKQSQIRKMPILPEPIISAGYRIYTSISDLRVERRRLMHRGHSLGLVPTMGALHKGHLSLIRHAAQENQDVWVSIYVNPTQFGLNEDLDKYPKTLAEDLRQIERLNEELSESKALGQITGVFTPSTKTMYPLSPPSSEVNGTGAFVTIAPLGSALEGSSRPVFFRGVATVCMKLFNIIEPDKVYFGQKDIQQVVLINRMIREFHINTNLRVIPTERELDGLALSSRNVFLGSRRRAAATILFRSLRAAQEAYDAGCRDASILTQKARAVADAGQADQMSLEPQRRVRYEVDYIQVVDPVNFQPCQHVSQSSGAIVCGALKMLPVEEAEANENLGQAGVSIPVRLIDNILLNEEAVISIMREDQ